MNYKSQVLLENNNRRIKGLSLAILIPTVNPIIKQNNDVTYSNI